MNNELIEVIEKTIELLRLCEETEVWVSKYERCRDAIRAKPSDADALGEIALLSAPRGFLGDHPMKLKADSGFPEKKLTAERWKLVEETSNALDRLQT